MKIVWWEKSLKPDTILGGTFLQATLGNLSYVWRSVLEAQSLVRAGVRRVIGAGNQVSILNDPWLVDEVNPYIQSFHPALIDRTVNSLMKIGVVEWDEEILADVLDVRDQNLVWNVVLSNSIKHDSWYWAKENFDLFSVKSAYRLLQDIKGNGAGANSGFWRNFWQLKIPPKVKNFMWRACMNCLPTRFQLSLKHVPTITSCPLCNVEPETILHVLVRCPFAQQCWQVFWVPTVGAAVMVFSGWVEEGLKVCNITDKIEVAMICWSIWKHRNELVWQAKIPVLDEVVSLAKLNFVDWSNAQKKFAISSRTNEPNGGGDEQWTTPDFPTIKVNVDGATFDNEGRFGFGMITRSAAGLVLKAKNASRQGKLQSHIVEALEIKEALSWIKGNIWMKVVESDCLTVISDLKNFKHMASPYGRVLLDCKALMSEASSIFLHFVKRSANKVAHSLARASQFEADRTFSEDTLPPDIASIVLDDLS